jgi:hypothetical protein
MPRVKEIEDRKRKRIWKDRGEECFIVNRIAEIEVNGGNNYCTNHSIIDQYCNSFVIIKKKEVRAFLYHYFTRLMY